MVEALRHESFYVTGTWMDESLGVYVGWVARKNSFSDGMPLRNERGDVVLVFSGEEFPGAGDDAHVLRSGARSRRGRAFLSCSPLRRGSVISGGIERPVPRASCGPEPRNCDAFQRPLRDASRSTIHESKDAFYFAAEAKAILAVRPELRRLDPRGVGRVRCLRRGPGEPDAFRGHSVLPPGSAWIFRNGSLESKRQLFPSTRMGRPRDAGPGILLSGAPRGLHAKPSAVFQRPGADRHVADGWVGHPDDYGLAEVPTGIPSLLYLRRHVPRMPGRPLEPAGGRRCAASLTR